jgi:hypothetical protein
MQRGVRQLGHVLIACELESLHAELEMWRDLSQAGGPDIDDRGGGCFRPVGFRQSLESRQRTKALVPSRADIVICELWVLESAFEEYRPARLTSQSVRV